MGYSFNCLPKLNPTAMNYRCYSSIDQILVFIRITVKDIAGVSYSKVFLTENVDFIGTTF